MVCFSSSVMVFGRKRIDNVYFMSSCPGNQPVVSVRFSHQFRESLLKAVFSRLYGGHFRPEKTELHRGSPSFYTKSPRSAEVRRASIPSRESPRSPRSSRRLWSADPRRFRLKVPSQPTPSHTRVKTPSPIKPPLDRRLKANFPDFGVRLGQLR